MQCSRAQVTSVAVLGAEGGAESVNLAQCRGTQLALQLTADGEGCLLAEEVLAVVDTAILQAGRVLHIESGDLEHLAGSLAVRGGNQRGVEVEETALVEESVDGVSHVMADTADSTEGVGTGTQVSNLAEELHRVSLLLQGIAVGVGLAIEFDIPGLDLHTLSGALRLHQLSFHADTGTRSDTAQQTFVEIGQIHHHLYVVYGRTVVQGNKSHILVTALGAHPALYNDIGANQLLRSVGEQLFDFSSFHV